MSVGLTHEAFHLCPFTERKRLSAPRIDHREPEYPDSSEALYVYRLAQAENDPTAATRLKNILAWTRGASADWTKYQPIRWALCRQVLDGSLDGWTALRNDPIYGQRARFECD